MNDLTFDALTRRASLMALGAAGVATFSGPLDAGAKKKGNKKKADVYKLCKKQVGPCPPPTPTSAVMSLFARLWSRVARSLGNAISTGSLPAT